MNSGNDFVVWQHRKYWISISNNIIRLYVGFDVVLIWHWTTDLLDGRPAPHQKYIRGSVLGRICTNRHAIAGKLRCSVCKLWQKYKCEKRASNIALQCESKKVAPPLKLFAIFSLRLNIFSWNFADLLPVYIHTCLPILVDLS